MKILNLIMATINLSISIIGILLLGTGLLNNEINLIKYGLVISVISIPNFITNISKGTIVNRY